MKPMLPKEHGAWGMVMLPALAGLAVAGAGHATGWLALAMVFFAYVARAPIEAWAKGRRNAETRQWLAIDIGVATALAVLLLALHRTAWLLVAVWVVPAAVVMVIFALLKRNRAVVNELVGTITLPVSAPVVYAAATNQCDARAFGLWLSFALYNALSLPYVRSWMMYRRSQKNPVHKPAWETEVRLSWLGLAISVAAVAWQVRHNGGPWLLLAWVPAWLRVPFGLGWSVGCDMPMKSLGWIEMVLSLGFALIISLIYRFAM